MVDVSSLGVGGRGLYFSSGTAHVVDNKPAWINYSNIPVCENCLIKHAFQELNERLQSVRWISNENITI